jgi:hypothetical protein
VDDRGVGVSILGRGKKFLMSITFLGSIDPPTQWVPLANRQEPEADHSPPSSTEFENGGLGGWMDPRAGLDDLEKEKFLSPPELELRHFGRPARNQSLYRLRYPGSYVMV